MYASVVATHTVTCILVIGGSDLNQSIGESPKVRTLAGMAGDCTELGAGRSVCRQQLHLRKDTAEFAQCCAPLAEWCDNVKLMICMRKMRSSLRLASDCKRIRSSAVQLSEM